MDIKTHCDSCGTLVLGVAESLRKVDGNYLCRNCLIKAEEPTALRYAGFWPRLGAALADMVVMAPLSLLVFWLDGRYRLFTVYFLGPSVVFGFFYGVYLVQRFGGTPGKLIAGIRVRKVNGDPVGYREALLRYLPDAILSLVTAVALLFPVFQMTDAEYHSLGYVERAARLVALAPVWYKPATWVQNTWLWSEMIVLLTNRKRRALHDFIAGTVVVHASPKV